MRASAVLLTLLAASCLGGCATVRDLLPGKSSGAASRVPAVAPAPVSLPLLAFPPPPKAPPGPIVVASTPVPNPPERRHVVQPASQPMTGEGSDPAQRVARANAAARVQPSQGAYANAAQIYEYEEGALFQVYTAPGQITDIALQAGESLSGTGPVAAGDTTRWVIGDTESGAGPERRVHILVKPTRANLQTNLVINTDRRTYHVELRATPATYMASVAWRYPADEARAAAEAAAAAAALERAAVQLVSFENLNFDYRIEGPRPTWRPVRVFDDGRQTFIEFPHSVVQSEMPPLFVNAGRGRQGELVNYRVSGQRMIIDRLFDQAELRLGNQRNQQRVRIERTARR